MDIFKTAAYAKEVESFRKEVFSKVHNIVKSSFFSQHWVGYIIHILWIPSTGYMILVLPKMDILRS